MTTAIYLSIRVDKEGLNADVLNGNLGGVAALDHHEYSTLPGQYTDNYDIQTKSGMEEA